MGLDRSMTRGNRVYQLVHDDLDPLVDRVSQLLALTPEEPTLREAVIDLSGLRQRTLYGESFRAKRQMRVDDLLFRAHHVMRAERDVVRAQLRRNGISLFEGMARFEGPHDVVVDTGSDLIRLNATNVVIATRQWRRHIE
jgi:pyruvate/2-oxoglutarate dehydrogenase complex dihydrolipoamide dehydrogenase (E3) component